MDLINSYAVVTYVTDPVAAFINHLRQEVTPGCPHQAHITILPPRPLYVDKVQAIEQCRDIVGRFEAFEAQLGEVDPVRGYRRHQSDRHRRAGGAANAPRHPEHRSVRIG